MEQPTEIIEVVITKDKDGITANCISRPYKDHKFKIQEIMLGVEKNRLPVKYTKGFLSPQTECRAEILKNGKLRII